MRLKTLHYTPLINNRLLETGAGERRSRLSSESRHMSYEYTERMRGELLMSTAYVIPNVADPGESAGVKEPKPTSPKPTAPGPTAPKPTVPETNTLIPTAPIGKKRSWGAKKENRENAAEEKEGK